MYSVLLTTVASFALCLLLTPLVRGLFLSWGIVDRPDGIRKLHARPVPRVGGVPIAIAYLSAYGVLILSPLRGGEWLEGELPLVRALMPAAAAALLVGLIDDLKGIRPGTKLAGQIGAALLAYWGGVRIATVVGVEIPGWWSLPLTVIWLVASTNAFNLIDGVDGLAAGVGLLATLTIFGVALMQQNTPLALATAPLAGCLLGFLRYNFNPASIFLGDSGSLLVGFLLGCYGVIWSQKSATILGMTAPMMALAVPLLDAALAVLRRLLRGKPIFGADRGHMHHRLLERGLTPRRVALVLYGVCGVAAAFSLVTTAVHTSYVAVVVIAFLGAAWLGVQKLGYAELETAGRVVFGGELQNMVDTRLTLQNLERSIRSAADVNGCWSALRDGCDELGFPGVEMRLAGRRFRAAATEDGDGSSWCVYVPLSGSDHVLLGRNEAAEASPSVIGPLADLIRSTLRSRLTELTLLDTTETDTAAAVESLLRLAEAIREPSSGGRSAGNREATRLVTG